MKTIGKKMLEKIVVSWYTYRNFWSDENKRAVIEYVSGDCHSLDVDARCRYSSENVHYDCNYWYGHSTWISNMYLYVDFLESVKKWERVFINEKEFLQRIIDNNRREIEDKNNLIRKHEKRIEEINGK